MRNHSQEDLNHARFNQIIVTLLHDLSKHQLELSPRRWRPLPLQHVEIPRRVLQEIPRRQRRILPRSLLITST